MTISRRLFHRGAPSEPSGVTKPQLTSLIDAMTILLLFLLKSFSVEGELVTPSADLVLPESKSPERPVPTVNVEVSTGAISVDGMRVATTAAVAAADSLMIPQLRERLEQIAQATGALGGQREVTIQCDRRVDFRTVKKVMYTCSQAKYSDFSLLVLQEGQS